MQKFQFKTYQRNDPTVRALKFEPGMESAWGAFDSYGRLLSAASREQDVCQAAPYALLIAPIIDLPGLSAEPLVFGNYLVLMDNGLCTQVPTKDFEAVHKLISPASAPPTLADAARSKGIPPGTTIDEG